MTYFAHSENPAKQWHPLQIHLAEVARLSRSRAANAPWAGEAELAGLLHDLGKYADRFQRRLTGQDAGLDHWSQGGMASNLERAFVFGSRKVTYELKAL